MSTEEKTSGTIKAVFGGKKLTAVFAMAIVCGSLMMTTVQAQEQMSAPISEQEQQPEQEQQSEQEQQPEQEQQTGSVKEQEADAEFGEITEVSRIMTAQEDIEAKVSPDDTAETVIFYRGGDKIYVTGETASGWCRVRYQDLTGYIRMEQVSETALDVEALDKEFAVEESEGKLVVEEVERQRTETKRSRIWGTVIVLLVAGVFATGIFSVVRSRKTGDSEQ